MPWLKKTLPNPPKASYGIEVRMIRLAGVKEVLSTPTMKKSTMPAPKVVRARPVTFWLHFKVTVKKA